MKYLCKFFCFFAATTLTSSGGVVANKAAHLGNAPVSIRGDVVNKSGKSNRLTFLLVARAANRSRKSDRIHVRPALFTDAALGGTFDDIEDNTAAGIQVVNRSDKVDRRGSTVLAQAVARDRKANPIRTTLSMRILAHINSRWPGSFDTERTVLHTPGLTGVTLAQAVARGRKADLMFTTIAAAEPAESTVSSIAGQAPETTIRQGLTQIGMAERREPVVFVPVTSVYDQSANNLAEVTPENAATKTLWN